jgi:hypothetical protein
MTSSRGTGKVARVALVTVGLSASGGLVGAVCAAAAVTVIAIAEDGIASLASGATLRLLGVAAGAGAVVGMAGAPLLGWSLLRRVPLGRAILVTAFGTVVGAVGGELLNPLNPYVQTVPGVVGGALAGFLVAGIGLRIAARRAPPTTVERAV